MATSIAIYSLLATYYYLVASTSRADLNSGLRSFKLTESNNITDGEVDEIGRVFLSAGSHLYQLSDNLELERMINLTSTSINISLNSDGRRLVVCMTDLSCVVYNAANLTSGPINASLRLNAIRSVRNVALFSTDDSFYVGSISINDGGAQRKMTLAQFELNDNSTECNNYGITAINFERNFFGGFVKGNNAYYFAIDSNPTRIRSIRVMRVCHDSDFKALYELTLLCGGGTPSSNTRISGVSVLKKFAGVAGPTVILSRNRPSSSQNYICLYSLEMIDTIMLQKYDSCGAAMAGSREQIELAWRSSATFCSEFQLTENICRFDTSIPLALDDVQNLQYNGKLQIDLSHNFITASVAVELDSFSFIFVAFTNANGSSFITGFEITEGSPTLAENSGFDRRQVASPLHQLLWRSGLEFIFGITQSQVIKIPIAGCSSHHSCTSCLGSGNPLCGWCLLENKCSKDGECQNFHTRWIQANKTNSLVECLTITVTPLQTITLHLSRSLPILLENEFYLCHLASNGGRVFTVEAIGSQATYTCNITARIPDYQQLITVVSISLASSILAIPFSTSTSTISIYQCNYSTNCSQCVQTNDACGWCVYSQLCTGISATCINGPNGYLQANVSTSGGDAVCPLLDQSTYQLPVQGRQIELITRNLPPPIIGFNYVCHLNGTDFPAIYNNQSSLTCSVGVGQLSLHAGISHESVSVTVLWIGIFQGQFISHQIGSHFPINVVLYNCEVANCCSSCLSYKISNGFECGWCDGSAGRGCAFIEECEVAPVTNGADCPSPIITDFNPKSGPIEGGTTITITGRDLGVTYNDFVSNSIVVGDDSCVPIEDNFIPGKHIRCTTIIGSSLGINLINITLPSGVAVSNDGFRIVIPEISRGDPVHGPAAGGTKLTVWGSNLNVGNKENTRLQINNGTNCVISSSDVQEESIVCSTPPLTGSGDTPMEGMVFVFIDFAVVTNASVQFTYVPNPVFSSVYPAMTILAGGIKLTFDGTNLNAVQHPFLVVNDRDYLDDINVTECKAVNFSTIVCVTPPLLRIPLDNRDGLNYTIIMDNAPGPNQTLESLKIAVQPNPENFLLKTMNIAQLMNGSIEISGDNLFSVSANEIHVTIGGAPCVIAAIDTSDGMLLCKPPPEAPGGIMKATVTVLVGLYLRYPLSDVFSYENNINVTVASVNILTPLLAVLLPLFTIFITIIVLVLTLKLYKRLKWKEYATDRLPLSSSHHTTSSSSVQPSKSKNPTEQGRSRLSKRLVIPRKQLYMLNKTIGQGEFGIVHAAHLAKGRGHKKKLMVAVKTLKHLDTDSDQEKVIAEINKMKNLHHPNIMPLIGVCLDDGKGISIVMPYMANGNLLDYLKKERAHLYLKSDVELSTIMSVRKLLLRICHQIAKGMEYLTLQKFVHRDLAARNCMLDSLGNVRVGDFGLAEDVYVKGYFRQGKYDVIKLPFKWMAPESLRDGLFSEKSDVWSFGITCWEVFSGGRIPYSAVDAISILALHEKGTRLDKPANSACAPEDFSVMMKCWALNSEDRPTFKQLTSDIDKELQRAAGYLELNMVLLPPANDEESDSDYEITENPFKEDSPSVSTPNPQAAEQQGLQLQATGEGSNTHNSAPLMIRNTIEIEVNNSKNGDYRELEASFTMTRNTSYSDVK